MNITPAQFREAYEKLPYVLRSYLVDDELGEVTESVGQKYNLHVDTIGALYREVSNMLLGLENPQQFAGELKSIGIPEASIGPITQELNQAIFVPLQEKMKNGGEEDPHEENDELSRELNDEPVTTAPVAPAYAPVEPPVQTPVSIPSPAPVVSAPIAVPSTPQATIRTMSSDMVAAKEHREPEMQPYSFPPSEPVAAPVVVSTPAQTPVSAASIINQIPVPQPGPAPEPQPRTTPYTPLTTQSDSSHREELRKIVKEYGNDPYREPIQ